MMKSLDEVFRMARSDVANGHPLSVDTHYWLLWHYQDPDEVEFRLMEELYGI